WPAFTKTKIFSDLSGKNNLRLFTPPAALQAQNLRPQASEGYGRVPMSYEANEGQFEQKYEYAARAQGVDLLLNARTTLLLLKSSRDKLSLQFAGSNSDSSITPSQPLAWKSNYYLGNDSQRWISAVPNFSLLEQKSLYPGIDLRYTGVDNQF